MQYAPGRFGDDVNLDMQQTACKYPSRCSITVKYRFLVSSHGRDRIKPDSGPVLLQQAGLLTILNNFKLQQPNMHFILPLLALAAYASAAPLNSSDTTLQPRQHNGDPNKDHPFVGSGHQPVSTTSAQDPPTTQTSLVRTGHEGVSTTGQLGSSKSTPFVRTDHHDVPLVHHPNQGTGGQSQ
jgi:hypothetical protein